MKLTNEAFLLVATASLLACEGAKVISIIKKKSMTNMTDFGMVQKEARGNGGVVVGSQGENMDLDCGSTADIQVEKVSFTGCSKDDIDLLHKTKIELECGGKTQCTVGYNCISTNAAPCKDVNVGNPCDVGVTKIMNVNYSCKPFTVAEADQGSLANMACETGFVVFPTLVILNPESCTAADTIADSGLSAATFDFSTIYLGKARTECKNKQSCQVGWGISSDATTNLIDSGDPCAGTSRRLAVKYYCHADICFPPDEIQSEIIAVTEHDMSRTNLTVGVQCSTAGFVANVAVCEEALGKYTIGSCAMARQCLSPDWIHEAYERPLEINLDMDNLNITVTCKNASRKGNATACTTPGGKWSLQGCEAPLCVAPDSVDTSISSVSETNIFMETFDVNPQCYQPGWVSTVTPCTGHLGKYSLSACQAARVCMAPKNSFVANAYASINEISLSWDNFDVEVTCANQLRAGTATKCNAPLEEFTISGCEDPVCVTPADVSTDIDAIAETNVMMEFFEVTATCKDTRYEATVTACPNVNQPYIIGACKAKRVCVAPPVVPAQYESFTVNNLGMDSFDVATICKKKHRTGKVWSCVTPLGPYILSGCEVPSCTQPPIPEHIANVTVISLDHDDFNVTATCKEAGTFASVKKCVEKDGSFTFSECQYARVCRAPDHVNSAYEAVNEFDLSMDSFNATAVCANGTRAGSVGVCLEAGGFYRLFGCEAAVCHAPDTVDPNIESFQENNVMLDSFDVKAVCKNPDWIAKVEHCQAHNTPYYVHECKEAAVCKPPAVIPGADDYHTIENVDLNIVSFKVVANCTDPNRVAHVKKCTEPLGEYTITGCHGSYVCLAPSSVSKAVKSLNEVKLLANDFEVEAECVHHSETASVTACTQEGGAYQVSGCTVEEVPLKWYVADEGNKSCTEVCQEAYQLECYADALAASVSDEQLIMRSFLKADFTCASYDNTAVDTQGAPYIDNSKASGSTRWMNGKGEPCYYGAKAATCDYHPNDMNVRRLCPCEEPLPPVPEVTTTTADPDQCVGTEVHGKLGCDAQAESANCPMLYMCTEHPAPFYEVCNQCIGRELTGSMAWHQDIERVGGHCGATAHPCKKPPR